MVRTHTQYRYDYSDIAAITGQSLDVVWKHAERGKYNARSLESVLLYCARHAKESVRLKLIEYALTRSTEERVGQPKKRKPSVKKAPS